MPGSVDLIQLAQFCFQNYSESIPVLHNLILLFETAGFILIDNPEASGQIFSISLMFLQSLNNELSDLSLAFIFDYVSHHAFDVVSTLTLIFQRGSLFLAQNPILITNLFLGRLVRLFVTIVKKLNQQQLNDIFSLCQQLSQNEPSSAFFFLLLYDLQESKIQLPPVESFFTHFASILEIQGVITSEQIPLILAYFRLPCTLR